MYSATFPILALLRDVRRGAGVISTLIAVTALAVLPGIAHAGTVSVEEGESHGVLRFSAAPGENNHVTVSVPIGEGTPLFMQLHVVDEDSPLQVGGGCSGGGAPGSTAICVMHRPEPAHQRACGRTTAPRPSRYTGCLEPEPGTGWEVRMEIALGDGDDRFDASSPRFDSNWPETVTGGEGSDTIITGGGFDTINGGAGGDTINTGAGLDTITPGPGDDVVHGEEDGDRAVADATVDGNDLLDVDVVDYSARSEPLHLASRVLGGTGEEDTLLGPDEVIGGSGDDHFISDGMQLLRGGPGDDTLIGNQVKDNIYGGSGNDMIRGEAGEDSLYGGDGNDVVEGGAGNDFIQEREINESGRPGPYLISSNGANLLSGGDGNDSIWGGTEGDTVEGGPGNDTIRGEAGDDSLEGNSGDDVVAGDTGADSLHGGEGDDRLLAGRAREFCCRPLSGNPVDAATDEIDCGPDNDLAQANRWDHTQSCETRRLIRAVGLLHIGHNRARCSATPWFQVAGIGKLRVEGKGVNPVSRYVIPEGSAPEGTGQTRVKLHVRARGVALAELEKRGKVTVTLRLLWHPAGQKTVTEFHRLTLICHTG